MGHDGVSDRKGWGGYGWIVFLVVIIIIIIILAVVFSCGWGKKCGKDGNRRRHDCDDERECSRRSLHTNSTDKDSGKFD